MANHLHHLDIYDVGLHIVTDERSARTACRRYDVDVDDVIAGAHGSVTPLQQRGTGALVVLVWISPGLAPEQLLSTCAHEAAHAAEAIFGPLDIPMSGEPLAYLIGWLTQRIHSVCG